MSPATGQIDDEARLQAQRSPHVGATKKRGKYTATKAAAANLRVRYVKTLLQHRNEAIYVRTGLLDPQCLRPSSEVVGRLASPRGQK